MEKEYNLIYKDLVEDPDDVLGIIAYSVYKRQKIEYIEAHGDSDLVSFMKASRSESQLNMYRNEADVILTNLIDTYLDQDMKDREDYFSNKLDEEIKEFKPSFWLGVSQSIVGSFGFIICLGILIFTIWSAKLGIKGAIESVFEVTITSSVVDSEESETKE